MASGIPVVASPIAINAEIISHGKDYLSLYGHNQRLLKKLGDNIKSGDIVAEAGNSGRGGDAALYFEIRHKGKPVNPRKWLMANK